MKIEATIKNALGLHLRAAAVFIKLASTYKCEITVEKDGEQVNGKSIMGVMSLAAAQGTKLIIDAEGSDAKEALNKLKELIDNKFGEDK